jgi:hypothetical protein
MMDNLILEATGLKAQWKIELLRINNNKNDRHKLYEEQNSLSMEN